MTTIPTAMKVRLVVTVEVDPQTWAEEYSVHPEEVREDVRRYFRNAISEAPAIQLAGAEVTVR
jgi:hypothetical protein